MTVQLSFSLQDAFATSRSSRAVAASIRFAKSSRFGPTGTLARDDGPFRSYGLMPKPVSEKAVFRRVKDALRVRGLSLKACPPKAVRRVELGRYYIVRVDTGSIDSTHVDLSAWARHMKVLGPDEHMVPQNHRRPTSA
jgi:hypothetical protein